MVFVLLSAIAVNMVIALGQLVIIGIGQMNLALGAIGGLVAISFVGVMEVYGVPPVFALLIGLAIGTLAGMASGYVIARTGISAFSNSPRLAHFPPTRSIMVLSHSSKGMQ